MQNRSWDRVRLHMVYTKCRFAQSAVSHTFLYVMASSGRSFYHGVIVKPVYLNGSAELYLQE